MGNKGNGREVSLKIAEHLVARSALNACCPQPRAKGDPKMHAHIQSSIR